MFVVPLVSVSLIPVVSIVRACGVFGVRNACGASGIH